MARNPKILLQSSFITHDISSHLTTLRSHRYSVYYDNVNDDGGGGGGDHGYGSDYDDSDDGDGGGSDHG